MKMVLQDGDWYRTLALPKKFIDAIRFVTGRNLQGEKKSSLFLVCASVLINAFKCVVCLVVVCFFTTFYRLY